MGGNTNKASRPAHKSSFQDLADINPARPIKTGNNAKKQALGWLLGDGFFLGLSRPSKNSSIHSGTRATTLLVQLLLPVSQLLQPLKPFDSRTRLRCIRGGKPILFVLVARFRFKISDSWSAIFTTAQGYMPLGLNGPASQLCADMTPRPPAESYTTP